MADNLHIEDINDYCLMEIMRFLSIYDIFNLDLTHSRFREVTPYFHKRQLKCELDRTRFNKYPKWCWEKIGPTVTDLQVQKYTNSLGQLLSIFPNVEQLSLVRMKLNIVPSIPMEINRLKRLALYWVRIMKNSESWFEQMSSSLTEIVLVGIEFAAQPLFRHLRTIKVAKFVWSHLSNKEMMLFLKNNRDSLESLELVDRGNSFNDEIYTRLSMMSKVTSLTISSTVQAWRLSPAFREQIEYLNILGEQDIFFHFFHNITVSDSRLETLITSHISMENLLFLVENIPTLKKVNINGGASFWEDNVSEGVSQLQLYLQSQERSFVLVLNEHEVISTSSINFHLYSTYHV